MINSLKNYLIYPNELRKLLKFKALKIIDCRWFLGQPKRGFNEYRKSHIPGALHFDLEKISNDRINLPHMLPDKNQFSSIINKFGISKKNLIVIYDQNGFFCSTRIWFTFFIYGFNKVKILDGGFKIWKKKKFKISRLIPLKNYKPSKVDAPKNQIIQENEIKKLIKKRKKEYLIIDARSKGRFLGEMPEPRPELRSGNIPGSINIPFNKITDKEGKLLNFVFLKNLFNDKIKNIPQIICSCGSGVTACNIFFILEILGIKSKKLYDGSWAEWGKK
jgi:thiosulfate/3-mercaptopyruvate sulfurtransferase